MKKKHIGVFACMVMAIVLWGCGSNLAESATAEQITTTVPDTTAKEKTEAKEDYIEYRNEEYGFGLKFPKRWEGLFATWELDGGIIFYALGELKPGFEDTPYFAEAFTIYDHYDEEEVGFNDNYQKIGSARGKDFYYGGPTDVALSVLTDEDFEKVKWMGMEIEGDLQYIRDSFFALD